MLDTQKLYVYNFSKFIYYIFEFFKYQILQSEKIYNSNKTSVWTEF